MFTARSDPDPPAARGTLIDALLFPGVPSLALSTDADNDNSSQHGFTPFGGETVTVIAGNVPPAGTAAFEAHESVFVEHTQPLPETAVRYSASNDTVTAPDDATVPAFVTTTENEPDVPSTTG
jgi:hypothetical protein